MHCADFNLFFIGPFLSAFAKCHLYTSCGASPPCSSSKRIIIWSTQDFADSIPLTKKQPSFAATLPIVGNHEIAPWLLCLFTFTVENLKESQHIFAPSLASPRIDAVFFGREPTSTLEIWAIEQASAWFFAARSLTWSCSRWGSRYGAIDPAYLLASCLGYYRARRCELGVFWHFASLRCRLWAGEW